MGWGVVMRATMDVAYVPIYRDLWRTCLGSLLLLGLLMLGIWRWAPVDAREAELEDAAALAQMVRQRTVVDTVSGSASTADEVWGNFANGWGVTPGDRVDWAVLPRGVNLPAVSAQPLDSSANGLVVARLTAAVYDRFGLLLFPAGTQLLGHYQAAKQLAPAHLTVEFTQVVWPEADARRWPLRADARGQALAQVRGQIALEPADDWLRSRHSGGAVQVRVQAGTHIDLNVANDYWVPVPPVGSAW